ncbi:hypothetical protein MNBD_NITROSPINAE05-212, partial [hydrothermal vent metagenome]
MSTLLPFFLSYLGGLLTALPPAAHFLWPFLLPALVAGAGWMMIAGRKKQSPRNWVLLIVLLTAGYFSPALSEFSKTPSTILNHIDESRRTSTLVGKLIEAPEQLLHKTRFEVEVIELETKGQRTKATGRVRLTHYHPELVKISLRAGDLVRFSKVRLKHPRNFRNPGAFDYRGFLKTRGIVAIGSISKNSSI